MTGMIYKQLRTNRLLLLICPGMVFIMALCPMLILFLGEEGLDPESATRLTGVFSAFGMFTGSMLSVNCFQDDESKRWSGFVGSAPDGIRRQVYSKYLLIFMMHCEMLITAFFMETVFLSIFWSPDSGAVSAMGLFCTLFFVGLFLAALDIPFIIRFGIKNGTKIKTIAIFVLSFAVYGVCLFVPFDEAGLESALAPFFAMFFREEDGAEVQIPIVLQLISALLPYVAMGIYLLSYRISCRAYLKGAETYDH